MSASKRNELVHRALESFYRGGFHAIGMNRLAEETGVSKTAIYQHFRTKEDLILATLELRDELFRNWLRERTEALASQPKDRLLAAFDALGEWFDEPGFKSCMFVKASSEYQDRDHPIHVTSAQHKRIILEYFEDLAVQARVSNPTVLAQQLLLIKEGAIVLAHLHDPKTTAATAKSLAELAVDAAFDSN